MKRKFFVFLSMILIVSVLNVPAFADEVYSTSDFTGYSGAFYCDIPEGTYEFSFYWDAFGIWCYTEDPVTVSYTYDDFDSSYVSDSSVVFIIEDIPAFAFGSDPDFPNAIFDAVMPGRLILYSSDPGFTYVEFLSSDLDPLPMGSGSVYLKPVVSSGTVPFLSSMVDSYMMSGVLDQVVDILPVVLGVLVGFIAIRKGISFLRGVISGA